MITMRAIIENERNGDYGWYAYLVDVPDPSTPQVKRGKNIGRLKGWGGTFNACQRRIKRTAERLGAKLLIIELYWREHNADGSLGRITESHVVWEPRKTRKGAGQK